MSTTVPAEAEPAGTTLLDVLAVEPAGADTFRGRSPMLPGRRNIFGGQVMAQALNAAARTVGGDRWPHSIHAYFLREGTLGEEVTFTVSRTRDGRSFSVRHVTASQGDRTILTLSASFQVEEASRDLQTEVRAVTRPDPAPTEPDPAPVPAPVPTEPKPKANAARSTVGGPDMSAENGYGVEMRPAAGGVREAEPAAQTFWTRTVDPVPDDRVLNACLAAYFSDLGPGGVAATAVGLPVDRHDGSGPVMASLDHAMWFHRPFRGDAWVLVDAVAVSNQNARGLIRGTMHDESGRHLASFAQELLVRER